MTDGLRTVPGVPGDGPQDEREALKAVAGTLLALQYGTWDFGVSVAFDAMLQASEALSDSSYARFAHGWARCWTGQAKPFRRLDCTAPGHAMVALSRAYNDSRLLSVLVELAEYLMSRPRVGGVYATWERSPLVQPYGPEQLDARGAALAAGRPSGVFVDCLHFDPPFLTALGVLTGQERYWGAGLEQARGYVGLLQKSSGLFDHFVLEGEAGTFGPGWGRGQGWALLGLLDVIEALAGLELGPSFEETAAYLRDATLKLISAMTELQREDGHWYAVVDDPRSGDEYSTAAFMAAGVARAVRMGLASGERVLIILERARQALLGGLTREGVLQKVSAAVMASTLPSHYSHVPTGYFVPWGQGPAALALIEAGYGN